MFNNNFPYRRTGKGLRVIFPEARGSIFVCTAFADFNPSCILWFAVLQNLADKVRWKEAATAPCLICIRVSRAVGEKDYWIGIGKTQQKSTFSPPPASSNRLSLIIWREAADATPCRARDLRVWTAMCITAQTSSTMQTHCHTLPNWSITAPLSQAQHFGRISLWNFSQSLI